MAFFGDRRQIDNICAFNGTNGYFGQCFAPFIMVKSRCVSVDSPTRE